MRRFLSEVFTPSVVNYSGLLLGVIGVLLTLFLVPTAEWTWKLAWTAIVVFLDLAILFAIAAHRFYYQFSSRLRVIRQVAQAGTGDYIIVFENPEFLREGSLVSLVNPLSGANQTIALLQVTRSQKSEPLQAKAFPPGTPLVDIGNLFQPDGTTALYVAPMVHVEMFKPILNLQSMAEQFPGIIKQLISGTEPIAVEEP